MSKINSHVLTFTSFSTEQKASDVTAQRECKCLLFIFSNSAHFKFRFFFCPSFYFFIARRWMGDKFTFVFLFWIWHTIEKFILLVWMFCTKKTAKRIKKKTIMWSRYKKERKEKFHFGFKFRFVCTVFFSLSLLHKINSIFLLMIFGNIFLFRRSTSASLKRNPFFATATIYSIYFDHFPHFFSVILWMYLLLWLYVYLCLKHLYKCQPDHLYHYQSMR